MSNLTVLSLGGSIIAPNTPDTAFLKEFNTALRAYLRENSSHKLILVCGGGGPARIYQESYREITSNAEPDAQDWIGIRATHLNGMLIQAIFSDLCSNDLVTDPTAHISFQGQVLVAAGWKPGFSTDTDAVFLAERFGGKLIVNLSNIAKVYTDDPRKNPDATPLDSISWENFRKMVGDEWVPGKNCPFDPIASKTAQKENMKVICADGRNIKNTLAILRGQPFEGTTIGD
ncbi:MAG: UMP kinase [Spirochaetia bacterium]|jgi:uridylate kinase|nr:UMP kinase [Spirochaetia bacterium]